MESLSYLASSGLCIGALACLSNQKSARLGNTQDVSKGLRRLLTDRLVARDGRGGRQAPFVYTVSPRGATTAHWAAALPPPPTPLDDLDDGSGHYWDAGLAFNTW